MRSDTNTHTILVTLTNVDNNIIKIRKATRLKESRTMPPPSLQLYLWPRVILTFNLVHLGCCDTMGM